jgi:hypothetical protein
MFLATSATALCGLLGNQALAQEKRLRVGIFDSRAIAIAAINSPGWKKTMDAVQADYQKAKAAGDETRMKEIKAKMQTKQRRQHEQGFSTGSVQNLLAPVKSELAGVAKSAGVDLIVSKWELAFQSPGIETVDVTSQIVKLYNPSTKALKWIDDIGNKQPIPIDDLPDDLD